MNRLAQVALVSLFSIGICVAGKQLSEREAYLVGRQYARNTLDHLVFTHNFWADKEDGEDCSGTNDQTYDKAYEDANTKYENNREKLRLKIYHTNDAKLMRQAILGVNDVFKKKDLTYWPLSYIISAQREIIENLATLEPALWHHYLKEIANALKALYPNPLEAIGLMSELIPFMIPQVMEDLQHNQTVAPAYQVKREAFEMLCTAIEQESEGCSSCD